MLGRSRGISLGERTWRRISRFGWRLGMARSGSVAGICCLWLASPASADELVLKNGDRLTGRIQSLGDETLEFESPLFGTIEVSRPDIERMTADESIEVHLADGSVFWDRAVMSAEVGSSFGRQAGPDLPLSRITAINPPAADPWSGLVTVGLEIERGNTFSQEVDVDLDVTRESDARRLGFRFEYDADRSRDPSTRNDSTTERVLFGEAKYDLFFTDRFYGTSRLRAKRDGPAGLDLRLAGAAGPGYRWIDTETARFETELVLSWVREEFRDSESDENYLAPAVFWNFEYALSDATSFFSDGDWAFDSEELDDRFVIETESGVRTQLTSSLLLELKIEWDYTAEPAEDADRQDADYVISLGYKF